MRPGSLGNYSERRAKGARNPGVAAVGKLIIANPDLVARFKAGAPLNDWDMSTFYASGARGYTDYPVLESAFR